MTRQRDDQGFSLIELLLVIVILGILATVVVFSVGGLTSEASDTGCEADAHVLFVATEAFFAQRGTDTIPAADGTPDAHEKTLVAEGFMRSVSEMYDVDASGQLAPASASPCVV
jgi:general secretion pathway protein G